jgi:hypothetical protein
VPVSPHFPYRLEGQPQPLLPSALHPLADQGAGTSAPFPKSGPTILYRWKPGRAFRSATSASPTHLPRRSDGQWFPPTCPHCLAAELAVARAKASEDEALIAQQKLQIAKLKHQIYGQRSERSSRLIEQLALTFEELEADATEDELAAERAAAKTTTVRRFTRKRAERQTFPEHLPRARVVIDPPMACECCGAIACASSART